MASSESQPFGPSERGVHPRPHVLVLPARFLHCRRPVVILGGRDPGRHHAAEAHRTAPFRPWGRPYAMDGERSPIALLGRRFAAGEIDEDEYWHRLSVPDGQFGRHAKAGSA